VTIPYRNPKDVERLKGIISPADDETKGTNITANTVLPSVIDTPSNREAMGAENADKWVKPESIAQVICFLASEAAKDVRGAAIPVYGNI
jgi:NAD(P)-dependent dehydrogenase (short-subunit alcohol dehydrogenase family)